MMSKAYLSLGTNMGDRLGYLNKAISLLKMQGSIQIKKMSSIYETDPVGFEDQSPFLNMVIEIETAESPFRLLEIILQIEEKLGRIRLFKWGPRTIDLDILLYNQDNIETEQLIVPHPRMHERAFVLIPLLEINDKLMHPALGKEFKQILSEIPKEKGVRRWKQIDGEDEFAHLES
ncbi:MAG TPA: 2-amino-4-hydroxy-6-hydroxymethyldihydropteridine diphosphokinase [Bacillus sp. (in: firmicutes)]|uniref:2-amino-4-hydroxy-6- hydroxymethyldihydropteridine diphosphokinase n=1 Tax=Bacillus litorisediminis TaxID=2922713 RepID=UPI001FACDC95|nr:2-amino-4-hydroxy-6-hydroxymethyldihydropteridine diphosphokinase [Bacillus litorisediminis]HWO76026.1 2-amino-4-hydroxy-6-hydroxymethyldihydropteridine diphosphokinase [Bacillus sp. (in: firmicutes)]